MAWLRVLRFGPHQADALHEARQALAEAESAARAKSDFLAGMGHEIRTPMNAIIGLSTLALKGEVAPRTLDYLHKIRQSGEHLLGILNDILDFSQLEAGQLEIASHAFELESVIDNVVHRASEQAEARGLELLCHVDPAVPRQLVGDAQRIGQMLLHYVGYAFDASSGGEVRLSVAVRERHAQEVMLQFTVTGTGPGLDADGQARLFQVVRRGEHAAPRPEGGTGLGLAICKGLAQAMGGTVGADSVAARGTTLWFTACLRLAAQDRQPLAPRIDLHGARVLVVDDNEAAALILRDMLASIGFVVQCADSGPAALQAMQDADADGTPFEFVMMDWQMPGMDGLQTVREIQALHTRSAPIVLMVSAHRRQELVRGASHLGIEHVLAKPVSSSLLFDTMMQLMGHGQRVSPAVPRTQGDGEMEGRLQAIAGARILLVEDNEINQQVAAEMLRCAGLQVELADNGRIALERVAAHAQQGRPFDLVLMDMQMPVLDGLVATRLIRAAHGPAMPIVAMTANAMPSDRERCLAAGMNGFLTKPIRPEELWLALLEQVRPRPGLGLSAPVPSARAAAAAGAPQEDALLEELESVAELDVPAGLRSTLGNVPLYASMLRMFIKGQADTIERIGRCLDAGDEANAERYAHTLKGVAASLGAKRLAHIADSLERCLRTGARPEARNAALAHTSELLEALLGELSALPQLQAMPQEELVLSDAERASAQATLQTIAELLAEDDSTAADLWESQAAALKSLVHNGDALDAAIRAFEFETALALLRAGQQD